MDIAASIRMGLAKNNMTQQELASIVGKRRETVNAWCTGSSKPSHMVQMDIADAFNVSVSEMIKWGE